MQRVERALSLVVARAPRGIGGVVVVLGRVMHAITLDLVFLIHLALVCPTSILRSGRLPSVLTRPTPVALHLRQQARARLHVLELPPDAELAFNERHVGKLVDMEVNLEERMSRDEMPELSAEAVAMTSRIWSRGRSA